MKWEGRCQRGSGGSGGSDAPCALSSEESHRRGGHGDPAAPTWRPHTAAELTERIRYKNPNAAAVRVMPGIPDPSLPCPFGGGTGGDTSREGCPGTPGGFDPCARPLPGSRVTLMG